MKTILDSIIDSVYYIIIYDFVYKIRVLNKNNNIFRTVQVCILEAEKGSNSYEKGSIINVPPETEIYNTKEIAIKEMLNRASLQYEEVKQKFYIIKDEYTYYNNLKQHYEEIFNIYNKVLT